MKTYCLSCEKHADNIGSKKVIMTITWLEKNQNVLILSPKSHDF